MSRLQFSIPIEVYCSVIGIYVLVRGHVVYAVRTREILYVCVGIESRCLRMQFYTLGLGCTSGEHQCRAEV